MKNIKQSILVSVVALFLVVGVVKAVTVTVDELREMLGGEQSLGSVTFGNEYKGTTLVPSSATGAALADYQSSLGSVIITGATGGALNIYNATTTNYNLRTGQTATSSLERIASFTLNQAVGTYTFDTTATIGIVYEWTGSIATSTITYR